MQTVLVIVKSECFRLAIQDALREYFDVITCSDATTGAEMIRRKPDAMILDLFLPAIDGISFLKNNYCFRPPVTIILTSYIDSRVLQSISDLGINYVIMKPCPISSVTKLLIDGLV